MSELQRLRGLMWALALAVAGLVVVAAVLPTSGAAHPGSDTAGQSITHTHPVYLPGFLRSARAPSPVACVDNPSVGVPSPLVRLHITPSGGINASTYTPGSFTISNEAVEGQMIQQVQIDLSTSIFPDMVFDPYGQAGDTVAKDVTVDSEAGAVGYTAGSHTYSGPHDAGFDALTLPFAHFDPGESFAFSVDVDPTSIKGIGAPGPHESGSVSGLELVGATVTATLSNDQVLVGRTYRIDGSDSGSEALLVPEPPEEPTITLAGLPSPVAVSEANQFVQISGPSNADVQLLIVEGGLFTEGLPGGGFDLDPYEANSAIGVTECTATLDEEGNAVIAITLTHAHVEAGLNYIVATLRDASGMVSATSNVVVAELDP